MKAILIIGILFQLCVLHAQQEIPECGDNLKPVLKGLVLHEGKNQACRTKDGKYIIFAIADAKGALTRFSVESKLGKEITINYVSMPENSSSKAKGTKKGGSTKPKDPILDSDTSLRFCFKSDAGVLICADYF